MKSFFKNKIEYYVWNVEFSNLFEIFFVSAVGSLLAIRGFLELTGYPKLGGGSFHIAHMLWGGLLMAVALFILMAFLNKHARPVAAFIGGVGFGTFIDELGKFITADNDYFYEPTIAFLYVIFVMLFLAMRSSEKYIIPSESGYAVNAIEYMKELFMHDFNEADKQRALYFLDKADPRDPFVMRLKDALLGTQAIPDRGPNWLSKARAFFKSLYIRVISQKIFSQLLIAFFTVYAAINLIGSIGSMRTSPDFANWGEIASSIVAAYFILRGINFIREGERLRGYEQFRYALLVSMLLTQFFLFMKEQLSALIALLITGAVYTACQYLIAQEKEMLHEQQKDPEQILQNTPTAG